MIKAGIFLDSENLSRCGGWGMDVEVVRKLVELKKTSLSGVSSSTRDSRAWKK